MASEIELKPCPFCGGKAKVFGGAANFCVRCTKCGITNEKLHFPKKPPAVGSCYYMAYSSPLGAMRAWNRRTP